MRYSTAVSLLSIEAFAILANAAPYPQADGTVQNGPAQARGSLYGSSSLLGDDGDHPDKTVPHGIGAAPLVPGQTANADYGLFLDFQSAQNPQPIRGSVGGTDPGPRTSLSGAVDPL